MNFFARRVPTVLGLLLLIGLAIVAYFFVQNREGVVSTDLVPEKVRITNRADNKFSVSWTTKGEVAGAVEYGKVGEKLSNVAYDERDTSDNSGAYLTHHVTIENLQPNTQYAFRILSGESKSKFDNNGSPYNTVTGPVIAETPPAKSFYGTISAGEKSQAEGALVYVALPGSEPVSTLVRSSGSYAISISTVRSADLTSYAEYDPAATMVAMVVESGREQSNVSVSTTNIAPVPVITLGQNADFRAPSAETPNVAVVEQEATPTPTPTLTPESPSIFNVEPLAEEPDINQVTSTTLKMLNPSTEGETLSTLRPEFRGTGASGATISIALTGQKAISDTFKVATDGTWSWSPVIDLKAGKQTITVTQVVTGSAEQKIARSFTASATTVTSDPAFVSSPSASLKPSASASSSATPSATPRVAMPATDSGVPVTGVFEYTLLTGVIGVVIMIVGATLLAL